MKPDTFTVAEAAKLVGIEAGRIRGWQQHQHIEFGQKGLTGRYRFSLRDVRCIALMAKLVDHGIDPGRAARQAETIVDRSRGLPFVAVFSQERNVSPVLITEEATDKVSEMPVILVPLGALFADIDARVARRVA